MTGGRAVYQMSKMKKSLLIVFLVAFAAGVGAQPENRAIVDQDLEWFNITSNIELTKKLSLMVEGQFRYAHGFEPMQYQARTALDIKLGDHFVLTPLAYVYTWNYYYGRQPAKFENNEHRTWQQIFYKHTMFGRIATDHRLRFEQRFIQSRTGTPDDGIVYHGYNNRQFRLRYRFQARLPLDGNEIGPRTWFLGVYDEVFMSRGKSVTFYEPDQNRIFIGPGYQFTERLTVHPGFLYQMLIKSNGLEQENNLGLQIMVTYNIKKKAGE
jgi:hypothetical protein